MEKRQKVKILQTYASVSAYNNKVRKLLENIQVAMQKHTTQLSIVIGDLNAKVRTTNVGETAIGHFRIGTRIRRCQRFEFVERNRLKIINTVFKKRANRKWTWRSLNGYKSDIDFMLTRNPEIYRK